MSYYNSGYYPYPQPQPMYQQPTVPQLNTINGKVVDGKDTARIQEVPIGGYGVYPKADMSVIYVKTWNPDGTTSLIEYPRMNIVEEKKDMKDETLIEIYNAIDDISKKLDSLKGGEKK